jgi:hypothetical protein
LRDELVANGRRRADEFSMRTLAALYAERYRRLAETAKPTPVLPDGSLGLRRLMGYALGREKG